MEYATQQIARLKSDIKQTVAHQKALKPQRKTDHFKGERTMPAWKAVEIHKINRYDLRHLYLAYGIMRGKSVDQVEPKRKTEYSRVKVDEILANYGQAVCGDAQ